MDDPYTSSQHSSEKKFTNKIKRLHQPDRKQFDGPKHKKFKPYSTDIDYTSDFDIVSLLKLELERILTNSKDFQTIIEDIQPYGSRVSGLYNDDSDVDFHIKYISKLPVKRVIKTFANILRSSKVFEKIFALVNAKIPIIKCVHKNTGIDCDISFNNISAVYNSHLLNHIISMDHRIKPVLMKLKIWGKEIGLINTNGFSSYSFYWLGLFFMQIIGILPTIHDLQKSIPELKVGHWNCAFSKNKQEYIKHRPNTLNENDILKEFYAYYSCFDFETYVISPYTGCPIVKNNFEYIEQLPEELWKYKQFHQENKDFQKLLFLGTSKFNIYVQDPFQHNVNITARVTPKIFEKFIKACTELKENKLKTQL